MVYDGLWDIYNDFHMGNTGELVAEKYKISREEQDKYAVDSHRKAVAAQERGDFKDEIIPVAVPQKKGDPIIVDSDEGPREDTTRRGHGEAEARVQEGRHGHGRERLADQRRRRGDGARHVREEGEGARVLPVLAYVDALRHGRHGAASGS